MRNWRRPGHHTRYSSGPERLVAEERYCDIRNSRPHARCRGACATAVHHSRHLRKEPLKKEPPPTGKKSVASVCADSWSGLRPTIPRRPEMSRANPTACDQAVPSAHPETKNPVTCTVSIHSGGRGTTLGLEA
jgi:hypothetical protein